MKYVLIYNNSIINIIELENENDIFLEEGQTIKQCENIPAEIGDTIEEDILYHKEENGDIIEYSLNKKEKENIDKKDQIISILFCSMSEAGMIENKNIIENIDLFEEWNCPINYKVGNLRKYNGLLYKCIQDHTSQNDWTPDTAVSLWAIAANPEEEFPAWSQPIGAHDAYDLGAKVSHNEKKWVSVVENNVWEPSVYGWEEFID